MSSFGVSAHMIFFHDQSVAYLERVENYRERYRCIVYAYVLMSNHVHLLIETDAVGYQKDHASDSVQLYAALQCRR
jgi:REP element-mobilizing transposase RayT